MWILDKLRRRSQEHIRAQPGTLAQTAAVMAATHAQVLTECLASLDRPIAPEAEKALVRELCRAYFCLVSLHVGHSITDDAELSLYGSMILSSLHDSPEAVVREAFDDAGAIDDAIVYYVHQNPSLLDREMIESHTRFLSLSRDVPVHYFAGLVFLRAMRLLKVLKTEPAFLGTWFGSVDQLITFVEALGKVTPVWRENHQPQCVMRANRSSGQSIRPSPAAEATRLA
jgi:hypothetical protein